MLRTLPESYKSNWREHLPKLIHAYNCTRHDATGFSPFFLLFGRSPRLPIDLVFGLKKVSSKSDYNAYVANWKRAMSEAYKIANAKNYTTAMQGKVQYDKRAKSCTLSEGDRVLVRNFEKGGPGKIRSYWQDRVYTVVKRMSKESPVYIVQPEDGHGHQRTLHRSLLYPCNDLPVSESIDFGVQHRKPKQNHVGKATKERKPAKQLREVGEDEETDIGFYPNELLSHPVHNNTNTLVLPTEVEPEVNLEEATPVDRVEDTTNLSQPSSTLEDVGTEEPHSNATLNPEAEPFQRPQRTRLPPIRLMYIAPGQSTSSHINQVHHVPRYVEQPHRTGGPQMIPFVPAYASPYYQLPMSPRTVLYNQQAIPPRQFWNFYSLST